MKLYILIVILATGNDGRISIPLIEFSSKEQCEIAAQKIIEDHKSQFKQFDSHSCIEKGKE